RNTATPETGGERAITHRNRMTLRTLGADRSKLAFRVEVGDLALHVVAGPNVGIVGNTNSRAVKECRVGLVSGNCSPLFDQAAARVEDVRDLAGKDAHAQPGEGHFHPITRRPRLGGSGTELAGVGACALGMTRRKVEELIPAAAAFAGGAIVDR